MGREKQMQDHSNQPTLMDNSSILLLPILVLFLDNSEPMLLVKLRLFLSKSLQILYK